MTEYHTFMRKWNQEEGINSFYGSDKGRFLKDWNEFKIRANPPKAKTLAPRPPEPEQPPEPEVPPPEVKQSATGERYLTQKQIERIQRIRAKKKEEKNKKQTILPKASSEVIKEDIMDDIWDVLHKYWIAHDALASYDWTGETPHADGNWKKSKKGRDLAEIYIDELRPFIQKLDDLYERDVIEYYEDRAGESYVNTTNEDLIKPSKLPTKDDILKRTEKWGLELKKLIAKLE